MQLDWMWALSAILAKTRSIRMSCCKGNKANHHVTFKENDLIFTWKFTSHIIWKLAISSKKSEVGKSIKSHGMVATKPALVMQSPSKIVPFVAGYTFISMVGEHITPLVGGLVLQNHPKVGGFWSLNLVNFQFFHVFNLQYSSSCWSFPRIFSRKATIIFP